MGKLELDNGGVIDIYGYDEIADYLYSNKLEQIWLEGRLDHHMMVEILSIIKE